MMGFLEWLELTGPATFVRESPSMWGYPTFLFAHTLGLSIVVGTSSVIAARVLGLASGIPMAPLARLFPLIWGGFVLNTISGVGLWIADAVNKTLPGDGRQAPIYLLKLLFVTMGAICMVMLKRKVFSNPEATASSPPPEAEFIAMALLLCWLLAMIAGRLIGYYSAVLG
jgi:hypothetical protein